MKDIQEKRWLKFGLKKKFNIWFQLEAHACDAQAELGVIPKKSAEIIWEKGKFDINKIDEIEKTLNMM